MTQFKLYLGRNISRSGNDRQGTVTIDMFTEFLKNVVTPRFTGFTVYHVNGYWQGSAEETFLLEIMTDERPYSANLRYDELLVEAIAEQYQSRFNQDSVLITKSLVDATFTTRVGV